MPPYQQQWRRIPSLSSETTLPTCSSLFSGVLTEVVQQIHSLRESGVISSQTASALASEDRAFRKSVGNLCTVPSEIVLDIRLVAQITRSLRTKFRCACPSTCQTAARSGQNSASRNFGGGGSRTPVRETL